MSRFPAKSKLKSSYRSVRGSPTNVKSNSMVRPPCSSVNICKDPSKITSVNHHPKPEIHNKFTTFVIKIILFMFQQSTQTKKKEKTVLKLKKHAIIPYIKEKDLLKKVKTNNSLFSCFAYRFLRFPHVNFFFHFAKILHNI